MKKGQQCKPPSLLPVLLYSIKPGNILFGVRYHFLIKSPGVVMPDDHLRVVEEGIEAKLLVLAENGFDDCFLIMDDTVDQNLHIPLHGARLQGCHAVPGKISVCFHNGAEGQVGDLTDVRNVDIGDIRADTE